MDGMRWHNCSATTAQGKEIFYHHAAWNFMFGVLLRTNRTNAIRFPLLMENIEKPGAPRFLVSVKTLLDAVGALSGLNGHLFFQPEAQRVGRTRLHAKRLLVFFQTVAAHRALGDLPGDLVLGAHP